MFLTAGKRFLLYVKKAKRKFRFNLLDFCIMGNHIHCLIKPDKDGNLSEIMQWIKCNFAKAWNKAQGRKGARVRRAVLFTNNQGDNGLLAGTGVHRGESGEGWTCGTSRGMGVWKLIPSAPSSN
ncbi:MAG: transposase [Treponema sp.]|nr:transposase [Treponema sp.]